MSTKKIVIVKRFDVWIGSCPQCAPSDGFVSGMSWESTRQWVTSHLDRHIRATLVEIRQFIEKVEGGRD